jgi:hypothetical protein
MKNLIMFVGIILLSSTAIFAQDANEDSPSENLVQYDPLFWKDKLKLDDDQCQKIREINGEYYQSLFSAYQEVKEDRDALRSIANKSLEHRNHEIWETFHPKQRKRWKRIWDENGLRVQHNES